MDLTAVREVLTPDAPKVSPEADPRAADARTEAESEAHESWVQLLKQVPGWMPATSPMVPVPGLAAFEKPGAPPLPDDLLQALRTNAGADAVLRFAITDYGHTPKAWRNGVIAFEVVSTLGIAAVAYARPATRALAGAYLLDETIEESIEAYSGFWALDEVYRPVRVQADLIDLGSGKTMWSDSETGFSDRRLARIWSSVSVDERRAQLKVSLHEAIEKLVADLTANLPKAAPAAQAAQAAQAVVRAR